MKKSTRDTLMFFLLLSLMIIFCTSCAAYAAPAVGAAVVAAPWYATINWAQLIGTLIGAGGIFAVVKYVLDYRLGVKKVNLDEKKVDNDEAADIRQEMKEMMDRMQVEINSLRKRIGLLETTLTKNNIPLPYDTDGVKEKDDAQD